MIIKEHARNGIEKMNNIIGMLQIRKDRYWITGYYI